MSWLGRLFRRERLERDLDKELKFHVDARTEELSRGGAAQEDARRRALAEFGGIEPIKEDARDARGTRWLEDCFQDVKYALRMLRSNKGFTVAAVMSLAVGIGANAAVFRVIDGLVLRTIDVIRPQELFFVESTEAKGSRFSHPAHLRLAQVGPEAMFAVQTSPTTAQVTINGTAELKNFQLVSGNWFSLLGVSAQAGRLIGPNDDSASRPEPVVVISDRFWIRQYGRAESAVGSKVLLNNTPVEIIGVAAGGFTGVTVGSPVDFWLPVAMQHSVRYRGNASSSGNSDDSKPWVPQDGIAWLAVVGRAPASVNREGVLAAMNGRYRQILEERLGADGAQGPGQRERRLRDKLTFSDASRGASPLRRQLSPALAVLMGMVGLVLVVACANLANLLLARGAARGREFALRLSIGARRGRLVRQLLTESMTLAVLGGATGLIVAWWGGAALLRLVSTTSTPIPVALPIDWRVITFGLGATVLTGLLFGLVPALRLSRPQATDALKSGGRVINAARRGRLPLVKVLVAVQVAVSLLLLTGSVLFFRTFQNLVRIDAGFERERVLTARFDPRLAGIDEAQLPALYASLLEETSRLPGVTAVSIGMSGLATGSQRISSVVIDRYTPAAGEDVVIQEDYLGPAYFSTLGIRLIAGRDFTERDDARAKGVAVINETMAKRYFGAASPLGRGFGYNATTEFEVVGVVADARANGLRSDIPAMAFYPLRQNPTEYARNLYVRTAGDLAPLAPAIKDAIKRAAPALAVREVIPMNELTERTVVAERLVARLAAVFGLLAVAVACLGLYGTIAYSVARRTNEIGVRLALGASPQGVRWMVLKETLVLLSLGVVGGLAIVLPAGRLLATQLYGLSPRDPASLATTCAIVIVVGLLAGAIPAWRASRVNPTAALRAD